MFHYGFTELLWNAAKAEVKNILIERAKAGDTMPYSELASKIKSIQVAAHDPRLFQLLGEVAMEEDAAGRGMLSAIVVHKAGDMQPGPGFFDLARNLGRDTSDVLTCWISEMKKVHAHWSR